MANLVPATIITGFLGAGKTSLIRHTIENNNGLRLAFLINEFGSLGIDRDLISGCGIEGCDEDDIIELSNGCICCTVADDFLPAMSALLARNPAPDHILIETSGLALPKPLLQAFQWPDIRTRCTVDGIIAVLDADALAKGRFASDESALQKQREEDDQLDHESPLEELFEEQLLCADLAILNKTDLLGAEKLEEVTENLKPLLRPATKLVTSANSRLPLSVFLGLDMGAENDLDSRPSHHDGDTPHEHDDFDSFVMRWQDPTDGAKLEKTLKDLCNQHDIFRIKGFLHHPQALRREVIQGVGDRFQRYFDRPFREGEARENSLVFIGYHGLDQEGITKTVQKAVEENLALEASA